MRKDAFILGGKRTPMGEYVGVLKDISAIDLGAIAARGAGKRYGPAAGVLLVCVAAAHSIAAMLLTVTRLLAPVAVPLVYRAAIAVRGFADERRADRLGIPVTQIGQLMPASAEKRIVAPSAAAMMAQIQAILLERG